MLRNQRSIHEVEGSLTPLHTHAEVSDPSINVGEQGRTALDFQVNNETYFIDLADEEGKWLVFAQTPTGVRRIPVYDDLPFAEDVPVLVEDKQSRKVVN